MEVLLRSMNDSDALSLEIYPLDLPWKNRTLFSILWMGLRCE